MNLFFRSAIFFLPIFTFLIPAFAAERHVPADYSSIPEAIEAAIDGDHIIVHPGRYYFPYLKIEKAVTIRSIDASDVETITSTILHGDIRFDFNITDAVSIEGLTLYGNIHCPSVSAVIRRCIINGFGHGGGNAVSIYGNRDQGAGTLIQNCIISFRGRGVNSAQAIGLTNSKVQIVNSTVAYSEVHNEYGHDPTGGIWIEKSDVTIKNSIIWGNRESNNVQIAILNNSGSFNDPLNSRVEIMYSSIEGGKDNILIFPDWNSSYNYRRTGNLPEPNTIDPNTLKWGIGNIDTDPLFVRIPNDGGDGWFDNRYQTPEIDESANNDYGDYHLKSTQGRFVWDGFSSADFNLDKEVNLFDFAMFVNEWGLEINVNDLVLLIDDYLQPRVFGAWVADDVMSPCIDAGDPVDMSWHNELWPHGNRINMGAYGGTPEASLSTDMADNPADF